MKSILKLQSGDSLPFVDYMPFQGLEAAAKSAGETKTSADSGSGDGDMDKGLKALLDVVSKVKGLPVDTAKMMESIKDMYTNATLFSNGQLNTEDLVNTYLAVLQQGSVTQFNLSAYEKAQDEVINNGGLNEVAIDEQGRLFVVDKETGKSAKMSVEEYLQLANNDGSRFQALTNHSLLQHRASDPQFAFENSILQTVSNGIGMKKVTEMLLQVAQGIGRDALTQEGYSEKVGNSIINGMAELKDHYAQGMTVEGLYKQGFANSDSSRQIDYALRYLWTSLPENAKALLKYKSGGDEFKAMTLMSDLLFSRNSRKTDYVQTLVKDPNSSTSGDAGTGNDFLSNVQAGTGGREDVFHVNLGGKYADVGMSISGTGYGMAITPSGQPIGQTSMFNMLQESRLMGIAKGSNKIYFGEQQMPIESLRNIAYTGDDIMRVNIPVLSDGSPNFALLKDYNDAQQEFLLSGQTDEDRLRIFGKYSNLTTLLNSDGSLNMNKFAPYVLVNGLTTDKLSGVNGKANDYVSEMKADPNLYKTLKSSLATGTGNSKVVPKIDEYTWDEALSKGWAEWLNGYDHIYKGVLYIPIDMNRNAAAMYSAQHLKTSERNAMEAEYQQNPVFLNYNANGNSADLLNY